MPMFCPLVKIQVQHDWFASNSSVLDSLLNLCLICMPGRSFISIVRRWGSNKPSTLLLLLFSLGVSLHNHHHIFIFILITRLSLYILQLFIFVVIEANTYTNQRSLSFSKGKLVFASDLSCVTSSSIFLKKYIYTRYTLLGKYYAPIFVYQYIVWYSFRLLIKSNDLKMSPSSYIYCSSSLHHHDTFIALVLVCENF